jgi:hypothetical protein
MGRREERASPEKGIATRVNRPRQFTVLARCTRVAIPFSGEGPLGLSMGELQWGDGDEVASKQQRDEADWLGQAYITH